MLGSCSPSCLRACWDPAPLPGCVLAGILLPFWMALRFREISSAFEGVGPCNISGCRFGFSLVLPFWFKEVLTSASLVQAGAARCSGCVKPGGDLFWGTAKPFGPSEVSVNLCGVRQGLFRIIGTARTAQFCPRPRYPAAPRDNSAFDYRPRQVCQGTWARALVHRVNSIAPPPRLPPETKGVQFPDLYFAWYLY